LKKTFLLIVVPALLVAFGFGQTAVPSNNADQASLKGCLSGSDGSYTVAEDGTTQSFKVTRSTVDLKPHVGHDVEIIGQRTNASTSSVVSDNSVVITGVNMISETCTPATANTPAVADPTPAVAASTPVAADPTAAATASTPLVADPTPTAAASAPVVADPAPTAAASTPVVADPAPTAAASTPAVADPPAAAASAPMETSAAAPESIESVPNTASPLPLLGLLGFGLLTAGLLSRRLWTNQR
jgi:hypothetical protein